MALFGKKNKTTEAQKKTETTPEEFKHVGTQEEKESPATSSSILPKEYDVLKVFHDATKNEVKKQVENSFGVKVKGVKVINLPGKKRSVGRQAGFKPGFKKAVVVLEKGHSIEGFQP